MERIRDAERGHLLVGLMVLIAVMLIMLTVTAQSWTHLMRRDREAELIFRGEQYARAIEFYKQEHGQYPLQLKLLAEDGPHRHRFIRRLWDDPLSEDGEWGKLYLSPTGKGYINPYATLATDPFAAGGLPGVLPGLQPGGLPGGSTGRAGSRSRADSNRNRDSFPGYSELSSKEFRALGGEQMNLPIVGVVHKKEESGLKIYKNQANLNDWAFTLMDEGQLGNQQVGGGSQRGPAQNIGIGDSTMPIIRPTTKEDRPGGRPTNPAMERLREDREKAWEEERRRREAEENEEDEEGEEDDDTEEGEDDPWSDEDEDAPPEDPNGGGM